MAMQPLPGLGDDTTGRQIALWHAI